MMHGTVKPLVSYVGRLPDRTLGRPLRVWITSTVCWTQGVRKGALPVNVYD